MVDYATKKLDDQHEIRQRVRRANGEKEEEKINHTFDKGGRSCWLCLGQAKITENEEIIAQFCYVNEYQKCKDYAVPMEILELPNEVQGSKSKYKCLVYEAYSHEI